MHLSVNCGYIETSATHPTPEERVKIESFRVRNGRAKFLVR
jgi:hypothetical protein